MLVTKAKRQIYEEFDAKRDEYSKFNTVMLANHTAPYYQLLAKKPITKIEDLKGMKIGLIGRWFGKWLEPVGVVPVVMPAGERYVSLQSGVIDADLLWLDLQAAFSLDEQTDYIVEIPFGSFVPEDVMMNLKSYNKLPEDLQQLLLKVGAESELYVAEFLKERHDVVMKEMQRKRPQGHPVSGRGNCKMGKQAPRYTGCVGERGRRCRPPRLGNCQTLAGSHSGTRATSGRDSGPVKK